MHYNDFLLFHHDQKTLDEKDFYLHWWVGNKIIMSFILYVLY